MSASTSQKVLPFKTVQGQNYGFPENAEHTGTMVKPGELVELIEVTPLNLTDLRIYNQLLANAWHDISERHIHKIPKALLRGNHKGNERIEDSINRLMGAIATVKISKDGEPAEMRVQLLGANVKQDRDEGYFYYTYPAELIAIINESTVFARLKSHTMYALRSKYAFRLYELIQKRVNLTYKQIDEFTVEEFRQLLGVPEGKLARFSNLNTFAIKPALEEVNRLSDHIVAVDQIREGRKVRKLRMVWLPKSRKERFRISVERELHGQK
ncbi:MAG: replication initiation protein [Pseudomonadota bacterium]